MNAKLLSLALLVLTAFNLCAQDASTNKLSYDELKRRADRNRAETKPATDAAAVAPSADWSATNSPKNAGVSAEKLAEALAATQATAPVATNTPPLRPARRPIALPGAPGATPAAAAVAPAAAIPAIPVRTTPVPAAVVPASIAPGLAGESMELRQPANASNIPDPNQMMPAGSINWTAATLEQVLTIYSEFVGRNLLRPATLPKAEIVLKQTTPLTKLEVVRMIEAALSLNMVAVINVGEKFVTCMPSAEAYKIPGIINTNSVDSLPDLGPVMTHIVQLKNSKPSEMVAILTPFASGTAANPVMPVDSSGILVLRDNVANVKRMLEMIDKVDIVGSSEIESKVIPIKYAKAEEIASALSSVGGGSGGTVGTRSSSSTSGTSTGGLNRGTGQTGFGQPGSIPGAQPTPSAGGTFGDRLNNIIRKASASGDLTILGSTKIIADIRSNSLLVFAGKQDMEMIEKIIAQLDVVLAQVLIETIIMSVAITDDWSLGLSGIQYSKSLGNNSFGAGGINNGQGFGSFVTNFGSALPTGFSYFATLGRDYEVALTAAASDGRATVIQKPRILTSHAKEGHIFLGESRAIVSSTYYGGGFGGGPSSSYQQQQAGIDLTVTPFVNTEGLVVMEINQEISDFEGFTEITGVGKVPNVTQRSIRGEVAVNDGETVILGGIVLDRKTDNKSGVPLLKDIPLIGALFSNSSKTKGRSELVVLMRPTVLKTPELVAKHTITEKEGMPAIMDAEADLARREAKPKERVKTKKAKAAAAESSKAPAPKSLFDQPSVFTEEDEKFLYSTPQAMRRR